MRFSAACREVRGSARGRRERGERTHSVELGGSLGPLDRRNDLMDRLALLSTDYSLDLGDEERVSLDRARVGVGGSVVNLLGDARDLRVTEESARTYFLLSAETDHAHH